MTDQLHHVVQVTEVADPDVESICIFCIPASLCQLLRPALVRAVAVLARALRELVPVQDRRLRTGCSRVLISFTNFCVSSSSMNHHTQRSARVLEPFSSCPARWMGFSVDDGLSLLTRVHVQNLLQPSFEHVCGEDVPYVRSPSGRQARSTRSVRPTFSGLDLDSRPAAFPTSSCSLA